MTSRAGAVGANSATATLALTFGLTSAAFFAGGAEGLVAFGDTFLGFAGAAFLGALAFAGAAFLTETAFLGLAGVLFFASAAFLGLTGTPFLGALAFAALGFAGAVLTTLAGLFFTEAFFGAAFFTEAFFAGLFTEAFFAGGRRTAAFFAGGADFPDAFLALANYSHHLWKGLG